MAVNPTLRLGGAFQAPPVTPVRGLATRGPAAAARATGGRVPVITTDQGLTAPAIEGPAGLAALKSELVGSMQDEIEGTDNIDQLLPKMLASGIATKNAALEGTGYETGSFLAGSGEKTISDDGSPAPAATDTAGTVPGMPVIPDNITKEQAKTIAMETMGLTGEEDYEDANTALMMFGLGLMATPGPLGQAIGIAGQKAMPQIIAAQRAKRARRKDVGVMAYNIREKNKAQRVAASAARLKQFNADRDLSFDLYKQQQATFTKQLDTYLKDALPGVPAKVLNHAGNADFAKIFGKVRTLGQTPEGMSQIMTNNGETLAQLAISSAMRSGDIKEGDLANYQDPGWTKFVARHPDKAGFTRNRAWSTKRAYAKNPKTGAVGWIEPGTMIELDEDWAPPNPTAPVTLWSFNSKTGEISQTTESGIADKAHAAFLEREANVLGIIDLADQASKLADEGGLFATSEVFSWPLSVASYGVQAAKTLAPDNLKLQKTIIDQTNKFTGSLNKYLGTDLAASKSKEYSDRGLLLNGQKISGKSGVASWLKRIENEGIRNGIADEGGFNDVQRAAFNNLASMQPRVRSVMFNMAYAVARAAEPGGRLTDRDIANAMMQLGGDKAGNIASPQIFKDVLQQTVRNTAARHQTHARQLPEVTGFPEYTIQKRWNKVERTLTGAPKELPAWVLQGGTTAGQQGQTITEQGQTVAAAGQQAQAQPAETLRTGIINAPTIRDDRLTEGAGGFQQYPSSLAETLPFYAQSMIDENGQLRSKEEALSQMGISSNPAEKYQNRDRIMQRMAARMGLDAGNAKVEQAAKEQTRALRDFYRSTNKAALLKSYLEPSLERIE